LPAELLRVNAQTPEADLLRYAAGFLTRGSVIAIPTDTFYGLAPIRSIWPPWMKSIA